MDAVDRRIVNALQGGFPICERPFRAAAERLGLDEAELIARIDRLLADGTLTRFGPLYHAERLGGALTLSLAQPLRVEDGALAVMAPTATKYGRQSLRFERREFEPTPSGRELRLGLGYSYRRGEALSALGEVLYVEEPGHVAGAEPQTVLRFGVRVAN